MQIDLSQFHQAFFDESQEGVDVMEAALLNLDLGNADPETINTVFRAAHSIKGGSATFGFDAIASFTHLLEALLDEMRDGRRSVDQALVDVLLAAVDCLRALLNAAQSGGEADDAARAEVEARLRVLLNKPAETQPAGSNIPAGVDTPADWEILFRPHADMLKSGNDPLRMFKELDGLGELEVNCDASALPLLPELDPEAAYLAWDLKLTSSAGRGDIDEVFAWVEGECELEISGAGEEGIPPAPAARSPFPAAPGVENNAPDTGSVLPIAAGGDSSSGAHKTSDHAALTDSGSIRVGIDKIDALINIVGELVITQSMLSRFGGDFDMSRLDQLYSGLGQLERNTRELQESVMRIRMLPIGFVFNRFPRMVRDISRRLGKQVELVLTGEQTELDKTVLEKIGDPMVHLVRNAIDHGLESPAERARAGKPETGKVQLHAYHEGGNIVVEISDDGAGLDRNAILAKARARGLIGEYDTPSDEAVYACIFEPGFSTREEATDLSGRGVGMDVVRRNINELGGAVSIRSMPGQGATFVITLPLTLAIMEGQSAAVGDEYYIVPLVSIVESLQVTSENVNQVADGGEVFRFRDEHLPIIRLAELFGCRARAQDWRDGIMIVVEGHGRRVGLFVDQLLGQQQAVVKSLEDNYRKVAGISGATVMGDGSVALILDIPGLIRIAHQRRAA